MRTTTAQGMRTRHYFCITQLNACLITYPRLTCWRFWCLDCIGAWISKRWTTSSEIVSRPTPLQSHAQLFFSFTSNLRAYVCLPNTSVLRQFFAFYQKNFTGEYIIARMARVCLGILHVTHADPTRLCQLEELVGNETASEAKTEAASGNRHSHHPSDWLAVAMIRTVSLTFILIVTLIRKPISSPLPLVRPP